jgi:hypothetical protein
MENMPYRSDLAMDVVQQTTRPVISCDWQERLPILHGRQVTLRDLRK